MHVNFIFIVNFVVYFRVSRPILKMLLIDISGYLRYFRIAAHLTKFVFESSKATEMPFKVRSFIVYTVLSSVKLNTIYLLVILSVVKFISL